MLNTTHADIVSTGEKRRASSVDTYVASRIKLRRKQLGVSQEKLALAVNLTFQQVQKYEKGTNRVSSGKLYDIALALQVPVSWFFDEIDVPDEGNELFALAATPDGLNLLRAFASIQDSTARKQIIGICKTVANGQASH